MPAPLSLESRPKRPLSAYNMFFSDRRHKILASRSVRAAGAPRRSHGKIGFSNLAKLIAEAWKNVDPHEKAHFQELAGVEKSKHKKAIDEWKKLKREAKRKLQKEASTKKAVTKPTPTTQSRAQEKTIVSAVPKALRSDATMDERSFVCPSLSSSLTSQKSSDDDSSFEERLQSFAASVDEELSFLESQVAPVNAPSSANFSSSSQRLLAVFQSSNSSNGGTMLPNSLPRQQFGLEVPSQFTLKSSCDNILTAESRNLLIQDMDCLAKSLEPEEVDYFVDLFH